MKKNDFIKYFFCALVTSGYGVLQLKKRTHIYSAFYEAITKSKTPKFLKLVDEIDFDPLHFGYSFWFESAIIDACCGLMADFRDGLRLEIKIKPEKAVECLEESGLFIEFRSLVEDFLRIVKDYESKN